MATKKVLRRPSKGMMLAVNASIDGKNGEVPKLLKEYKLSRTELKTRLAIRDGEKYDLTRKGGRPRGSTKKKRGPGRPRTNAAGDRVLDMISGRTKTVTLLRLSHKIEDILATRSKKEVEQVDQALADVDDYREKYEAAMSLIEG